MRLPNGERAQVDQQKIADYTLNPSHPRGRNKARVFAAALGLKRKDATVLREWLLELAATSEAADEVEPQSYAGCSKFAPK